MVTRPTTHVRELSMEQIKLKTLGYGLLLTLLLVLAGCGSSQPQLQNGQPAPGFSLPRLEGGRADFPGGFAGQVVAIRFWADWCPFCEEEMSDLEPVYRELKDRGLTILAVNVRQDADTAERFIRDLGITYGVLLDEEGAVARGYGVMGLPTTFFVDREGVLRAKILGESTPDVFTGIVNELLAETPK